MRLVARRIRKRANRLRQRKNRLERASGAGVWSGRREWASGAGVWSGRRERASGVGVGAQVPTGHYRSYLSLEVNVGWNRAEDLLAHGVKSQELSRAHPSHTSMALSAVRFCYGNRNFT
jgi:hypothetical protein